jgi:hypothetical protein
VRQATPFFVSYAHNDSADVVRFRRVLEPLLKGSREFAFGEWIDGQILPGENWRAEIDQAMERSCFGLLLISPEFLASDFIMQNELPLLLAKPRVVPVELQRIVFDGSMDLKGMEHRQVFRDAKGRPFDRCRAMPDRREFAGELFKRIIALLKKYPC